MTVEELHKKFAEAQLRGETFEYTCIWDGCPCVRHTELGYAYIISEKEVGEYILMCGDEHFYEVEQEDGAPLSKHYRYYYMDDDMLYFALEIA